MNTQETKASSEVTAGTYGNVRRIKMWCLTMATLTATTSIPLIAQAAPRDSMLVWRAQVRVEVCDVKHAGTDDRVSVKLRSSNATVLDYGRDDFERGQTYTYDLGLDNVMKLQNITRLEIRKTGSDGLCVKRMALLINGETIYSKSFDGHWLDNANRRDNRRLKISGSRLRASEQWRAYKAPPPPTAIAAAELVSRIESMVGNYIARNRIDWRESAPGPVVEIARRDQGAVHVDLDLEYVINNWRDPSIDVDFDLRFYCAENKLSVRMENVDVDVDTDALTELLTLGFIEFVEDSIGRRIERELRRVQFTSSIGVPFCPDIIVLADGTVSLAR